MDFKKAAFSQFPRPSAGMTSIPNEPPFDKNEHSENVMGYSIRVDQYRFTDWCHFNRTTGTPNFTDIWATELYNHTEPTVLTTISQKYIAQCYIMFSACLQLSYN